MSISRFQMRKRTLNANKMYKDLFHERGVKYIKHYRTGRLEYPSQLEIQKLETNNLFLGKNPIHLIVYLPFCTVTA